MVIPVMAARQRRQSLSGPGALLLDAAGHLYLADLYQTGLPNVVRVMSVPGFVVTPLDFTFATTSSNSATIAAGGSTNYTFNVMPTLNAFPGTVTFSVAGLPAGATASFSPSTLAANSTGGAVTMTVATSATAAQTGSWFKGTTSGVALGLLLLPIANLRRRKRAFYAMFPLLLLTVIAGCGGSSSTSGPSGSKDVTSTITVTATSGTITHMTTVTLIVN